jgi:hypothetical protein
MAECAFGSALYLLHNRPCRARRVMGSPVLSTDQVGAPISCDVAVPSVSLLDAARHINPCTVRDRHHWKWKAAMQRRRPCLFRALTLSVLIFRISDSCTSLFTSFRPPAAPPTAKRPLSWSLHYARPPRPVVRAKRVIRQRRVEKRRRMRPGRRFVRIFSVPTSVAALQWPRTRFSRIAQRGTFRNRRDGVP